MKQFWISLMISIFLCLIVETIGSFWTEQTVVTWYPTLIKPLWTPPDWIFAPVWTCLYIMIAIAGALLYQAEYSDKRAVALMFYCGQLTLNLIWSFLFFALRSPALGLIDIILLSILICITIIKAWPVRRLASILLIPYLLWVLYATSLNAEIWWLNR